jgi:hypothetical protein
MALTKTEIEILLKARNEAQGAFDSLGKQIQAVTGTSGQATTALGNVNRETKNVGATATATGVAIGLLAERVATGLVNALKETLNAANRLDAGLVGLGASARAYGVDAGTAQKAAQSLASDGLMSVGEAATGLKNLLASGFGLEESVVLMNRFKDSASFGRQGALEFGQAIVGATEGIKNGNSATADNAGLTKNLSNILVEAGKSATDLSKVQSDLGVRTALYNGILKETNPQLGNTALYLETAAGKQAQFNSAIETAQQKIGKELQPAVSGLLNALMPLAGVIGENADVIVPLGLAIAGVVGPIAAMRAATALGLTDLIKFGAGFKTAMSLVGDVKNLSNARYLIQEVGTVSGVTVKNLGYLGSAAAVAGAGFAGWQIGRLIGELTGLDGVMERLGLRLMGVAKGSEEAAARQDVINRAIEKGAPATVSYADAIQRLSDLNAVRIGLLDKSTAAQERSIAAQERLGFMTKEHANAQLGEIESEKKVQAIREARVSLAHVVAQSEKQIRDEIVATRVPLADLLSSLKNNEEGFKAWAAQVGLSDAAVKALEEKIRTSTEAKKKAAEAAKDLAAKQKEAAAAAKEMRQTLEGLGIVTLPGVNEKINEFNRQILAATAAGVPMNTIVRAIWPELEKLALQAKNSGVGLKEVAGYMRDVGQAGGMVIEGARGFDQMAFTIPKVTTATGELLEETKKGIKAENDLIAAYKRFGLETPAELQKVAAEAERDFLILRNSGTATTAQLRIAYEEMVDAQRAATGKIPTFWETEVVPGVKRALDRISESMSNHLADMLTGQEGFREGFVGIWDSIKKSVTNILGDILDYFISTFIKSIIANLAGTQGGGGGGWGGWANAIGNYAAGGGGGGGGGGMWGGGAMVGGGGGTNITGSPYESIARWAYGALGGGGAIGGTTSLAGVGTLAPGLASGVTGASVLSGGALAGSGTIGGTTSLAGVGTLAPGLTSGFSSAGAAGAGGAGAAGGGGLAAGLAGAGLAGGAGLGLGYAGTKIFGGAGWKASGFGAGTGAATGALIGSVVPGIGTAVGAIVGGLAGAIGGWIGESVGEKINNARDEFQGQFATPGQEKTPFNAFNNLAGELNKVRGGDAMFKKLQEADSWDELNAAVKRIVDTLEGAEYATVGVREAFTSLQAQKEEWIRQGMTEEQTIEKQADSYSKLFQTIKTSGAEVPEAMIPIFQSLIDMGLLVDGNNEKVTTLADIAFIRLQSAASKFGTDTAAAFAEVSKQIDAMVESGILSADQADEMRKKFKGMEEGAAAVEDTADQVQELSEKAAIARDRAEALRQKLFDQENAHTNIEGSENRIDDLALALHLARQEAEDLEEALRRAASVPAPTVPAWVNPGQSPVEGAAAGGVMANRPGLVIFGEGGETEVGGPAPFFRRIFESLGFDMSNGMRGVASAQAGGHTFNFNYHGGPGGGDLVRQRQWFEREALPMMAKVLAANPNEIRTKFLKAQGIV